MASDFIERNNFGQQPSEDSNLPQGTEGCPPCSALDNLKRDRFELLSAYLDGEVTADERRRVEDWLHNDTVVQQLYARLLRLRRGLQMMPCPAAEQSVEQTVQQVMGRVDRRPRVLTWGGAAIAAMFVGGLVLNFLPMNPSSVHQMAGSSTIEPIQSSIDSEALMIALDQPIIEIPKAVVSDSYTSPIAEPNTLP